MSFSRPNVDLRLEASDAPRRKRRRLNLACNYCRSRKTKCDETKPSCHACLAAGLPCITTDRKRPGQQVERREAGPSRTGQKLSHITDQSPDHCDHGAPKQGELHEASSGLTAPQPVIETLTINSENEITVSSQLHEQGHKDNGNDDFHGGSRFRGRLPMMRNDTSSSSMEILTGWLNLACFRLGLNHRFTFQSTQNQRQLDSAPSFQTPALPDVVHCRILLDRFMHNVNILYPIFEGPDLHDILEAVHVKGIEHYIASRQGLPHLVILLLALDLGSARPSYGTLQGSKILSFCKDMLGRLLASSVLHAVQATFLLALDLYQHDDLTSTWYIIGLCASMATNNGLGKYSSRKSEKADPDEAARIRTWRAIFSFEKLLAFELGRQSLLKDEGPQLGATDPISSHRSSTFEVDARCAMVSDQALRLEHGFSDSVLGLARLLGQIGHKCIQVRDEEETSSKEGLEKIIADKITTTGEACLLLTRWAETLPDNIRPNSDLIYDGATFATAMFISMCYYNSLLTLTRNSLLISEPALRQSAEVISKGKPWKSFIQSGQSIAGNTARRIIKLFIDAEEIGMPMLLPNAGVCLHAMYVLSVYILRHPQSRLIESDLNLINYAADFTKHHPPSTSIAESDLDFIVADLRSILRQTVAPISRTSVRNSMQIQKDHSSRTMPSTHAKWSKPTPAGSSSSNITPPDLANITRLNVPSPLISSTASIVQSSVDGLSEYGLCESSLPTFRNPQNQNINGDMWQGFDDISWDWSQLAYIGSPM